jgi:hypothetical protein
MSVQVQLRRDTLANVLANHGAPGEVYISTDTKGLFVQDGATNGGFTPNGTSPARARRRSTRWRSRSFLTAGTSSSRAKSNF